MLGQRQLSPEDYLEIWRRRKAWFLACAFLGPLIGYGLTFVLPPKYISSTLVLVEQPKVPDAVIHSVVSDALGQRLLTMQEQILSRTRLQPLIERFNLYASEQRKKVPMEELVAAMRKNIKVDPIKPNTITTTAPTLVMPGFTISFASDDPKVAQQICGEITSMFMEENLKIREQRAQGTTDFLTKNLEQAKLALDEQDAKMAEFKRRYAGQLPGQEGPTTNVLMALNAQLEAATSTINRTQQDKAFAESQLAQEQAAFEASQTTGANPVTLEQQLAAAESALTLLEARYTADHPDVIKARGDVAQIKKRIEEASKNPADPSATPLKASIALPPQIQNLRTLIHTQEQTLEEKTREQQRLQAQIKIYQSRLELSPMIEEEYKKITRDYGIAVGEYNELLSKRNNSELSTDLERRQQGEQFRVMDPPNLPEEASFPNPFYFSLGGIAGGLAIGTGLMALIEMRDKALRNEGDIEFFLGLPTLALLPSVGENNSRGNRGFWRFGRKTRGGKTVSPLSLEA